MYIINKSNKSCALDFAVILPYMAETSQYRDMARIFHRI